MSCSPSWLVIPLLVSGIVSILTNNGCIRTNDTPNAYRGSSTRCDFFSSCASDRIRKQNTIYVCTWFGHVGVMAIGLIREVVRSRNLIPVKRTLKEIDYLLVGATLGGNLTPIGASANITGLGILRKDGYEVSAKDFMKISVPFTLAAVTSGYILIWLIWR
jgi:hypothetical protein